MAHHRKSDINYFLNQPFIARTHSNNKQLHEERLVFNHIAYLEVYRRYAIKIRKTNQDKININKILVESIELYLELYFKYINNIDSQRLDIAKALKSKIETIKLSEYSDLDTKIVR